MTQRSAQKSWLQAILSLLLPGLGQVVGGDFSRGFYILLGVVSLSGLTVYTAATRARFPDYGLSFQVFLRLLPLMAVLIALLGGLYRLVVQRARDEFGRNLIRFGMVLLGGVVLGLAAGPVLAFVVPAGATLQLYAGTAYATSAVIAAIWLWNVVDAWHFTPDASGGNGAYILLLILALIFLGVRLVQIDLNKAVLEYKDTQIILSRLVWPWKAAFDYEQDELRASALIEAPCDYPEQAPEVNQPSNDGTPWVRVTPTCGEPSQRDKKGNLTFGTQITIEGGGFAAGETVTFKWENPIGNSFTPRGVGETEITVGEDGTFVSQLYIPDVVIPDVAEGAQIHTLYAIQSSGVKFSGRLSRDLILALRALLETIMMGLMATFAGIILSVPLSFLAARNLMQSITTTTQGFVGGVIGLIVGAWLGRVAAQIVTGWWGGLEYAPLPTALTYFIFILAAALLFYRWLAQMLDQLAGRLPKRGAQAISLLGMALIGLGVGAVLGVLYARGVYSITRGDAAAAAAVAQTRVVGAILGALLFLLWGQRLTRLDKIPVGMLVYTAVRLVLNIIRSIEPLIWAVMGVIWIGPGPFAGFIALTIHSVAALGKLYSESIESINEGPIEALQATGANRLQTIIYAVVPQVLPPFTSFTLYRWDINVRMSTIIGMVGGGGIGFLLIQWIRQFQYLQAGMAVWMIAITVAILDFVSASIREKMV